MSVVRKDLIYEGKAKKIFGTDDPLQVIQEFKDSLTAFNAQKKGSFQGKGAINLQISGVIFEYLGSQKISHHMVKILDSKSMLVRKLKMFPLEVVVRNRAAGSICQRLGLEEGRTLSQPLVELYFKDDKLGDPILTDDHVLLLGLANKEEVAGLKEKALLIDRHLIKMFGEIGIDLIDFKIEFGRDESGQIILADEISPDSCRLWDSKSAEKLDKDRFRRDLGKVEESYKLVCDKIVKRWGSAK